MYSGFMFCFTAQNDNQFYTPGPVVIHRFIPVLCFNKAYFPRNVLRSVVWSLLAVLWIHCVGLGGKLNRLLFSRKLEPIYFRAEMTLS